jgi:cobalamin synthase
MSEQLKVMKTIHLFLVGGLAFAYFFIGDLQSLEFLNFDEIQSADYIFLLIPVAAIVFGNFLFKNNLQSIPKNATIEEKAGTYQTASLIRWAIVEGASFFFLFYKSEFILLGLLLVLYLLFLRPTENKMKGDLKRVEKK